MNECRGALGLWKRGHSASFRAHSKRFSNSSLSRGQMIGRPKFVLASGSPRRLALINQAGIEPDALKPADLDETPHRSEIPRAYATRLAHAKATAALENVNLDDELRGAFILAADTVVAVGRRILPKAELLDEAAQCLRLLSGRNHRRLHRHLSGDPKEAFRQRLVETRVRFKRLSEEDIEAYLASGEWRGKAGGYAAQGIAGTFIVKIVGSYTNVVGLPLYEVIDAAGRRGLSDSLRLAERGVRLARIAYRMKEGGRSYERDRPQSASCAFLPDLREAGRAGLQAFLFQALRGYRSQSLAIRRLCGSRKGRRRRRRRTAS